MGWGFFGGQVIGQAIACAQEHVTNDVLIQFMDILSKLAMCVILSYHKALLRKGRTYSFKN